MTLSTVYTVTFLTRRIVFTMLGSFCVHPPSFLCNISKQSHNTQSPVLKTTYVIYSVFLQHMKALLKKKDTKRWIALKGMTENPLGDMMHQKWPSPHPNVTAGMKINFSSVYSALELFFLSTLAHWVKCKLFNSLCNLSVYQAKENSSDLMLSHDLEYLRNYKAA